MGSLDLNPMVAPVRDLGEFIREQRVAAQISVRALAEKAGVSNPYLSQVERGLRRPSAEILAQIARALSMSVETLLAMAGILESPEPPPTVLVAIRADPALTERQKAALAEIYASFRRETLEDLVGRDAADGHSGQPATAEPRDRGAQEEPIPAIGSSTAADACDGATVAGEAADDSAGGELQDALARAGDVREPA